MSARDYIRSFGAFSKTHLLQLNLFESGIQDQSTIHKERRTTRVYLLLLIASVIIVGFYYTFVPYTHTYLLKYPSLADYSTVSKQVSLRCPCTRIAVRYIEFLRITPSFHSLCQNNVISNALIQRLYALYEETINKSISTDVHRIAVFQFQTLRTLCQLTKTTLNDNLNAFLQSEFVQTQLMSSEELQKQMTSLTEDLIHSTPTIFLRTLSFIQNVTTQSLFMTGASVTSVLPRNQYRAIYQESIPYDGMTYTFTNGSSCTCSSSSANACIGLATFNGTPISGFITGCYMLNALLHSTLEVFFNQTLLNILTQSANKFRSLNSSVASFNTIESLLRQMFVTNWLNETSFEDYFKQCAPVSCQYTIVRRHDFLFILTTLIGLLGGLSAALRIITPFAITILWPWVWNLIRRKKTHVTPTTQRAVNKVSMSNRIKRLFSLMKRKLMELNLFPSIPPSQDMGILRLQRYITRFHIILLTLAMVIITIFTSMKSHVVHVTTEQPSSRDFIHLNERYSRTLHCPCNQTTFDRQFISHIEPQYHQICSSDFVSSNWINVKFIKSPKIRMLTHDIRYQSEFHFQLLATLCQVANQTIKESLDSFYRTKFVSNEVFRPQTFQTQIDFSVEEFKRTVPESFQRTLQLLTTNSEINQFITPMNSYFHDNAHREKNQPIIMSPMLHARLDKEACLLPEAVMTDTCFCFSEASYPCYQHTKLNETKHIYIIPGMFQTWFPLQALLMSTLECLYNQTCLSHITQYIDNTTRSFFNTTVLNSSLLSSDTDRYERIKALVNKLFIQAWKNSSSFQSYFNHCRPLTCQYTYQTRVNLIYIVTAMIGYIGGINVVLHLLLPPAVKLTMKLHRYLTQRQRKNVTTDNVTRSRKTRLYNRFYSLVMESKQRLKTLNLFITIPFTTDPKIIRRNRRTTRVYLIALFTAFSLLIIYTLLKQETVSMFVESPSFLNYQQLFLRYPITLQCPCANVAIKYSKFIIQLPPEYHEVCSSDFVSQKWFESITNPKGPRHEMTELETIVDLLRKQFETLSTLCNISRNMLNTSLSIFQQSDFLSAYVISEAEFVARTKLFIEQYKIRLASQLVETFKLIEVINHGNQLATMYYTNWLFMSKYVGRGVEVFQDKPIPVLTQARIFGSEQCSCGIQSNCSKLSHLTFSVSNRSFHETLPGFHIGCLPFDSLLRSSLTCLYNTTCVSLMQAAFYMVKPIAVNVLKSSSIPNTTIETLLSQFFVSRWLQNMSYRFYYEECAPELCQYSYVVEYNILYMMTVLIATFGGLTNGLHFILKFFAAIFYKIVDHRKKTSQVAPYAIQLNASPMPITESPCQPNSDSVEEQRSSKETHRERFLFICLVLFAIIAILTACLILLAKRNQNERFISPTTHAALTRTEYPLDESTSTLSNICHMTLKYQSQTYSTDLNPVSLVTGDFNQDSFVDFIVANANSDTLTIVLGNGDGTFGRKERLYTGNASSPQLITAADFNNDTLLDLVVTLTGTKEIVIFFGVKSRSLFVSSSYILPRLKHRVLANVAAVADFNSDGFLDLAFGHPKNDASIGSAVTFYLNVNGDRKFMNVMGDVSDVTECVSLESGDFNRNGIQTDLSFLDISGKVTVYTFLRRPQFANYLNFVTNMDTAMLGYPSNMVKGKFNYDDFDDLAYILPQSNLLRVFLTYRDIFESAEMMQTLYLTDDCPTSLAVINFNNDEIDDLASLHCNGMVTIFVGTNTGLFHRHYLSFTSNTTINTNGKCFQSLHVADLNHDDRDDLIFIDNELNNIRVILGSPCGE